MYKNFQCRNVQEMKRSIVKHCTPRSQIMWNVTLNSSYTSSYIFNVDQNKKRKQSPRMRRRDCNLPLKRHCQPQCICLHFTLKVMECQQITIINISLVLCRYNSVKMSKYNHRMVEIYDGLKTKT